MRKEPRSLAEDLRQRTDEQLEELLSSRPDLLIPVPSDLSAVASRATTSPSLSRCLESLDAIDLVAAVVAAGVKEAASLEALAAELSDRIPGLPADAARASIRHLLRLGLLWGGEDALRTVHPMRLLVVDAPPPAWPPPAWPVPRQVAPEPAVRDQSSLAILLAVDAVREVVEWVGRERPLALKSGGVASREVATMAADLALDRTAVCLWLELARAARMIAVQESWLPTERFDRWALLPTAEAWSILARTWLANPGAESPDGRDLVEWRRATLDLIGEGGADLPGLLAVLNFRRPQRAGSARDEAVAGVIGEATLLGVCALGELAPPGIALLHTSGRHELAAAAEPLVPKAVSTLFIQSDLTITAPGPLDAVDARMMRRIARAESRGHATVSRITPASIRRALEDGVEPADIIEFLERMTHAPLPQPLLYLIREAGQEPVTIREPRRAPAPSVAAVLIRDDAALALRTVQALRAAESPEREVVLHPPSALGPARTAVAVLRTAIASRRPVWIGYAESDGTTRTQLVDPIRLGDGGLTAFDHGSERVRTFAMARITGIASSDQEEGPAVEGGFDEFDEG